MFKALLHFINALADHDSYMILSQLHWNKDSTNKNIQNNLTKHRLEPGVARNLARRDTPGTQGPFRFQIFISLMGLC